MVPSTSFKPGKSGALHPSAPLSHTVVHLPPVLWVPQYLCVVIIASLIGLKSCLISSGFSLLYLIQGKNKTKTKKQSFEECGEAELIQGTVVIDTGTVAVRLPRWGDWALGRISGDL